MHVTKYSYYIVVFIHVYKNRTHMQQNSKTTSLISNNNDTLKSKILLKCVFTKNWCDTIFEKYLEVKDLTSGIEKKMICCRLYSGEKKIKTCIICLSIC